MMMALLLSLIGAPVVVLAAFTDVPASSPYADGIQYVEETGIVEGYSDGSFRPNATINRAEFTKILIEATELSTQALCRIASFTDVSGSAWYYPYVQAARCHGIVDGYADSTFKPGNSINIAEAAKILASTMLYTEADSSTPWYKIYIDDLADWNAIPIQISSIDALLTRGQMAEMIYRLQNIILDKSSHTYETLVGNVYQESSNAYQEGDLLPLGDEQFSSSPKKGYIYSCQTQFNGRGAFREGEWIQGDFWDPSMKPIVDGSNTWSAAYFTLSERDGKRIITGNGLPVESVTGNYPVDPSDDAYNYDRNPNSIQTQAIELELPLSPTIANNPSCVPMGLVGVATNGVAIFNGFDAEGRDAAAHEILDTCEGHPQQQGMYHYHRGSDCIEDDNGLIGYAIDGFGIYKDASVTSADLDECHGRTSTVLWNGTWQEIYHYVLTDDYPYTIGCFRGTPVNTGGLGNDAGMQHGPEGMLGPQGSGFGPPQAAISACSGKSDGSSCSFSDGHTVSGTCRNTPDGTFACMPAGGPPR